MLPLKNRLKNRKKFEETNRLGSFFSFGKIFLKVKKNSAGAAKIGFSVGLKFSPKAVERNRIKRQLREIIRKNLKKMKSGFDLVISVKKFNPGEFSRNDLERDLLEALKKAKLI